MLFKFLTVGATSTVKFFFSIPIGLALGLSYLETIITSSIGGIVGIIIFYVISTYLHKKIKRTKLKIINRNENIKDTNQKTFVFSRNKRRKKFSKRNKSLIQILRSSGLYGIAILTPVALSIPFGAFIAAKYFNRKPLRTILTMSISVIIWSLLLSTMVYFHIFL